MRSLILALFHQRLKQLLLMNWDVLDQLLENGYIKAKKHPKVDLYIYNYTAKTQYERMWNDWTLSCRGLIMNKNREVIARPFPKFFNLGEMESQIIPNEPFEVFDKVDGSMGVLYWANNQPFIATRGSFNSEQSKKANSILYQKYQDNLSKLDRSKTYVFEIIYPENRIVVDYGDREELILLGIIDTQTGIEEPLQNIGFPLVTQFNGVRDLSKLKSLEENNREGFVVKFKSGLRIKVKFDEYQRIHRIVTNVSSIDIWDYLKNGLPFDEILERVPDEFYDWVRETEQRIKKQYMYIEETAKREIKQFPTQKETALYTLACQYPSVMFAMMSGKKHEPIIWKLVKPAHEKPFSPDFREGLV